MHRTMMAFAATWMLTTGAAFGQGATRLQVVNATSEKVEIRIDKPVGGASSWLFTNGRGRFNAGPLSSGLGDRVVSVRVITANGTIVLPSKVLALSKFDPAHANQEELKVIFISGIAGFDIVYTTGSQAETLGQQVSVKGEPEQVRALDDEQRKAIEETLKMPESKGGGF